LLAWGGAAAPAGAAAPHWTITPASGGADRPYVYAEGTPGSVLEDKVAVTNPTDRPLKVTLRGVDADHEDDGSPALRERAKDTGAWIRFADTSVRIPARTRAEVPFTVSVPAGAVPGDHPGAVVARAAGRDAAVSVHLRVSGPTLSALTVERVRVVGGDAIRYDVVNRGNTTLRPRLTVRADGLLGAVLDRGPRSLSLDLLPGRRVTLTEPWRDAPALDDVDVKVTVTAGGGAGDSATARARFVPWGALGGGLAVLAAGGCVAYAYRRRRRQTPDTQGSTS
ncbi:hypothetical protein, partial [Streptomyces sp. SID5785]|uniref:COG1470 family protein n=1 Tax=Streptomyces sp. SID5785 TaxID=2690309 RepID=UPI0031BB485B